MNSFFNKYRSIIIIMDFLDDYVSIDMVMYTALFIIVGIILIVLSGTYFESKKETKAAVAALPAGINEGYLYWFKFDGKRALYKIINGKRCFWDPVAYIYANADVTAMPTDFVVLQEAQIPGFMAIPEGEAIDVTSVLAEISTEEKAFLAIMVLEGTITQ